ncbi:NAD(P)H nitroreductase [Mycobacterium sp. ACS4331]|uniref:Acg family FMN-binding oxidoreductase n=1 Tax=Mycobacterium sp. ACS4331 TaxID=1834121 RepID=UPI0007FF6BEF|nr:NAD(P)H nitroreductase [Mycobacterium sp. ACS4331]OBF25131.1 NAD(P)H nitroreductase [Mycobacterium sp. ACS4331]
MSNKNIPDDDPVLAALALATRAPSVHNSQPWHFRVGSHSIQVHADTARRLPHTDPDSRDLIVSCGVVLHHCTVALAALGWRATIQRIPDPAQPDHLAALQLHRGPPDAVDIAMAAAIPRRRTDRRPYSTWPVALGDIALIGARAARLGVVIRRCEVDGPLRSVFADAVPAPLTDDRHLAELPSWRGHYAATSGVPARNAPAPDPTDRLPGRLFAGPAPDGGDHGVLVAMGTRGDDDVARLRAGEATSAALLTATASGLATCLMSEVLEVPETRARLREALFDHAHVPQTLLRIGWPSVNSDPLPATPRRPLTEMVFRLDGSPFR